MLRISVHGHKRYAIIGLLFGIVSLVIGALAFKAEIYLLLPVAGGLFIFAVILLWVYVDMREQCSRSSV